MQSVFPDPCSGKTRLFPEQRAQEQETGRSSRPSLTETTTSVGLGTIASVCMLLGLVSFVSMLKGAWLVLSLLILKTFTLNFQVHLAVSGTPIVKSFLSCDRLTEETGMIYSGSLASVLMTSSINC